MKIKLLIFSFAVFFMASCSDENLELTSSGLTDQFQSKNKNNQGGMAMASMSGMFGELRINAEGNAQCFVASHPDELTDYANALENAVNKIKDNPSQAVKTNSAQNANIQVTYLGFTPEAQAAFQSAVDTWSSLLESDVDIHVIALFSALPPGVLGAAGSTLIVRDAPGLQRETWYGMALADKLIGEDAVPGEFDIVAQFSSVFPNWYYGTDGNTPADQYDFRSVVLHELCHGLGFFGSASVVDGVGSLGFGTPFPAIYDRFAVTRLGKQLVKENKYPNPSLELGDAFTGDQILFTGNNVIVATKGDRAKLFTYPLWLQGSSYSHLDEFTYLGGTENALMTPFIGTGESYSGPGPIVLSIFDDIGWDGKIKKPVH